MKKFVLLQVATKPWGSNMRASSTPAVLAWDSAAAAAADVCIGLVGESRAMACAIRILAAWS
jgi:hypothetical protein